MKKMFLGLVLMFVSAIAVAANYSPQFGGSGDVRVNQRVNVDVYAPQGEQGAVGATGAQGERGEQGVAGYDGLDGNTGAAGASYSRLEFNQGMASISAMSNIPAISNTLDGKTGVGVGLGSYNSRGAVALGVMHQSGNWNFKASMARARHSASTAFGIGATLSF